jgi:hypothetical protein
MMIEQKPKPKLAELIQLALKKNAMPKVRSMVPDIEPEEGEDEIDF